MKQSLRVGLGFYCAGVEKLDFSISSCKMNVNFGKWKR